MPAALVGPFCPIMPGGNPLLDSQGRVAIVSRDTGDAEHLQIAPRPLSDPDVFNALCPVRIQASLTHEVGLTAKPVWGPFEIVAEAGNLKINHGGPEYYLAVDTLPKVGGFP